MVRFAALLRRHGLPVTPEHVTDGARALEQLDLADREEVRVGLRAVFAGRPEDFGTFDRVFDAFWRVTREADRVAEALAPPTLPEHAPPGLERAGRETLALDAWQEGGESDAGDEPVGVPAASELEAMAARDFSTFSPDQLDEVYRVTLRIARRLARRISRRRRPSTRRGRIDLRRTLRANLTRGELIDLRYRRRKRKKVRLVLLCDVSGSMDLYSRFLLQFLFALQSAFGRVETFTFATRLTRVTEQLKGPSYQLALRRLTDVRDFSGGTRIGESLQEFNRTWGHLVNRHTIVIVLSDGWDTGEPELLANEMLTLRRKAGRVMWLNP